MRPFGDIMEDEFKESAAVTMKTMYEILNPKLLQILPEEL